MIYNYFPKFILSMFSLLYVFLTKFGKVHNVGYGTIISPDCNFEKFVTIYGGCKILSSEIGKMTYIANNTRISYCTIGRFCSIAQDVVIGPGIHPTKKFISTHPAFYSTKKQAGVSFVKKNLFKEHEHTFIGNDVLIGLRSIIMDGIIVGDGAIIAAGSVVTKDVPPYAIVGGVPAAIIRYRFCNQKIKKLLVSKWWNHKNIVYTKK